MEDLLTMPNHRMLYHIISDMDMLDDVDQVTFDKIESVMCQHEYPINAKRAAEAMLDKITKGESNGN